MGDFTKRQTDDSPAATGCAMDAHRRMGKPDKWDAMLSNINKYCNTDVLPLYAEDYRAIITAIRENVLRLPKSLVRSRSDGTAMIQVWKDDKTQERLIHVGLRGDSYAEILSGLQVDDMIISEFGS